MNYRGDRLRKKHVLVTRPEAQAEELCRELRAQGARVSLLPLVRISPPDSFQEFDLAFAALESYDWLIFASSNAVETSLARASVLGLEEKLSCIKIACVGPATARALKHHGLVADLVPGNYSAAGLLREFPISEFPKAGRQGRVLWARTATVPSEFVQEFAELGWCLDTVHSYKSERPEDMQAAAAKLLLLFESGLDWITLTSSLAVSVLKELCELLRDKNVESSNLIARSRLAVIGAETEKTCIELFGRVDLKAQRSTIKSLAEALSESVI